VLGGWQLSGNTVFQTGQFLTPGISVPDPVGIRYVTSSTRSQTTVRPDVLRNPNLETRTIGRWFDTEAFAAPATRPHGAPLRSARGAYGPAMR
jgi:hypothetical protein